MGSVSGRECAYEDMHVVEQVLHERLALVVNYRNQFPRMPTGQPGGRARSAGGRDRSAGGRARSAGGRDRSAGGQRVNREKTCGLGEV